MNQNAKITLSSKELDLVCNTDWILTKHSIIQKVYDMFGALAVTMQQSVANAGIIIPGNVGASSPKISKGENYRLLPYVMLDYPRYFSKEDGLAIRTFFWWGNFFSITLQLSGICKEKIFPMIEQNLSALQKANYYICIAADPWQHHFENDNYLPLDNYTVTTLRVLCESADFIKIAKNTPLQQWDNAAEFLDISFKEMILLLKD